MPFGRKLVGAASLLAQVPWKPDETLPPGLTMRPGATGFRGGRLVHHARATDRRAGHDGPATGVQALAATGLHYAAKTGFAQTVEVLLQHGADPRAQDARGHTPLDWLEQGSARPAAREQIRRLLTSRQT